MKVVHVITGLGTGGAETMLHKLLSAMDSTRFNPVVVSLLEGGEIRDRILEAGIPVHVVGMSRGVPSVASLVELRRLVRGLAPDIIQGWMYHGNLAAAFMSSFAPEHASLFWNIRHSLYDLGHEKALTRMIIRLGAVWSSRPRRIVYNSGISMEQHALLGYSRDRGVMLPNGFDLDRFRPDPAARAALRSELALGPESLLVGVVGRRHPLKGHDGFLRAAADLHRRRPEVHFVLAGRGITQEDPEFREFLRGSDLARRVHFLGQRSDTPQLFAALDLLALPSVSEGFPNVLGEAMSCGIPCVATDVGEAKMIVGDTGRVVPPGNPAALAEAMGAMLETDPRGRADRAERCRARILENYSLEKIAEQYAELYTSG